MDKLFLGKPYRAWLLQVLAQDQVFFVFNFQSIVGNF